MVWVQHKQNATWEPAIVVNQCAPNSSVIMQENGAEQPRVYRCTRTTPTDGEQKAQVREWSTETGRKARLQNHCVQVVLHWEIHLMHKLHQGHASQHVRTLESQPRSIVTNFTCKDTITTWISGLPVENVKL